MIPAATTAALFRRRLNLFFNIGLYGACLSRSDVDMRHSVELNLGAPAGVQTFEGLPFEFLFRGLTGLPNAQRKRWQIGPRL
jgi:hypothetical protein